MGLRDILTGLGTLTDLQGLVRELGAEPCWRPVPAALLLPAGHSPACAVAGSRDGFRWFAIEAGEPGRAAVAAARRLLERGRPAGIIAHRRRPSRLAFSVAFGDTPVLEVDPRRPSAHALAALRELAGPLPSGLLAQAADVARILGGGTAGRRFFTAFDGILRRMAGGIEGLPDPGDRHALALLQLTRVLFLYFVQAKGWLDGREAFLRSEVDRCLGRGGHLHRHLLRPLFFGTLNRQAGARAAGARGFGRVPFLNGGLFEPHPLERRWQGVVPNALWRDAFDGVFERFRFTVDERSPGPAIAPDMLGRVFEGVMDPAARRTTGTFYTPPSLVSDLFDATLAAWLGAAPPAGADRPRLRRITVLDPAVGSGAFLLGALDRLTVLQDDGRVPRHRLRRRILTRNLFGVDLNPAAVRLTELRLWLAVIADDPADRPERVAPLPNLDCLIRQGDSLMDPLGALETLCVRPGAAGASLARLRLRLVEATGPAKAAAVRTLRRAESEECRGLLEAAAAGADTAVRECLSDARSSDLFGMRRGMDPVLRSRLELLRARRREARAALRRLTRDGQVPWFQYRAHFADVFRSGGGFDIVVSNPPWVRAEGLHPRVREALGRRYRWWQAGGRGGFGHQPDLAVAFLERAHELAAPGGAVGLLLPAKLATAGYAGRARAALARDSTVHLAADLTDRHAREFDATVYPMALVAVKRAPPPGHRIAMDLAGGSTLPQAGLGIAPWPLHAPEVHRAVERLRRGHPFLADRLPVRLGVKTGADDIFLDPPAGLESDLLRPAVRGRDLAPFRVLRRRRLLWPCREDGRAVPALPPKALAYLRPHEERLRARADYAGGPFWTLFRPAAAARVPRVIWPDCSRVLSAVPLTDEEDLSLVPLNTCYAVEAPGSREARALAGWLNSSWMRACALVGADRASGGFARHNARVVAGLPLPEGVLQDHRLADAAARGAAAQDEIDALALRHLDLSSSDSRALGRLAHHRAGDRR